MSNPPNLSQDGSPEPSSPVRQSTGLEGFAERFRSTAKALPGLVTALPASLIAALIAATNFDALLTAGMTALSLISGVGGAILTYYQLTRWQGPIMARMALPRIPRLIAMNGVVAIVGIVAFVFLGVAGNPLAIVPVAVYPWFITSAVALVTERERLAKLAEQSTGFPADDPYEAAYQATIISTMARIDSQGGPDKVLRPFLESADKQRERLEAFSTLHPQFKRRWTTAYGLTILSDPDFVVVAVPPGLTFEGAVALTNVAAFSTMSDPSPVIGVLPSETRLDALKALGRVWAVCYDGELEIATPKSWAKLQAGERSVTG